MANPVGALRTMRALAAAGGVTRVGDERVGDAFTFRRLEVLPIDNFLFRLYRLDASWAWNSNGTKNVVKTRIL